MIFSIIILIVFLMFHYLREKVILKQSEKISTLQYTNKTLQKDIENFKLALNEKLEDNIELATTDQLSKEMLKRKKMIIVYAINGMASQINSNLAGEEMSQVLHSASSLIDRDI